ncbi:MAG: prolipoprotein diacylglyceryl transferase [Clostridiales bacterium]|jgi:phosphatidylglycerol:prolipoprotein diacylglycerol transferase|nr:prolipoprotein diacylglyceryl transferase [Clostridiales bacterium]
MAPEVWFPHLGIQIERLPQTAFTVFGFPIYIYGVLIGLAITAGVLHGMFYGERQGYNHDLIYSFMIWEILFCIVGARLYYVIFQWDYYKDNLVKIFAIREGGLAIYGAIITAFIVGFVFTRVKKLNFWDFADTAIICLALGQAVGRWGNFFNREAFGTYTNSLFAIRYLVSQTAYIAPEVLSKTVEAAGARYIQVHPTFLYESALCLSIVIFLDIYTRFKKARGEILAIYLMAYGIGRFFIEGLRTDQLHVWGTNIAVSQIVSVIAALIGLLIFIIRRAMLKTEKNHPE